MANLYDPQTETFSVTGARVWSLPSPRAVPLDDGRVLVVEGSEDEARAELYDPEVESFAAAGSLLVARRWPALARLGNGNVLVVGGSVRSGASSDLRVNAELYDPSSGGFVSTGGLLAPSTSNPTATLLTSGRVLFIGLSTSGSTNAELYDASTAAFVAAGHSEGGAAEHSATLLRDGRVLVFGSKLTDPVVELFAE